MGIRINILNFKSMVVLFFIVFYIIFIVCCFTQHHCILGIALNDDQL